MTRTKNIKQLRISKLPFNKSEITGPKIIGFIKKATISIENIETKVKAKNAVLLADKATNKNIMQVLNIKKNND